LEVFVSKWIVWSRPAPIKVLAVGTVIAIAVALPLVFILQWLGVGQYLVARLAAILVGTFVGLHYVNSRKPAPKNEQP
jgi:hypothetical protein